MSKNNSFVNIISGIYRNRKILTPGSNTHPMGARERNALFNRLNVRDLRVLDAYAGSGALGIEAISRGAILCDFLDKSPTATCIIKRNLDTLGIDAKVYTESAEKYAAHANQAYDIIVADPPYNDYRPEEIAHLTKLLVPNGVLALSSPADLPAPELPNLTLDKTNTYAGARISTYIA